MAFSPIKFLLISLAVLCASVTSALGATFTVTTTIDDPNKPESLRYIWNQALANGAPDTINFNIPSDDTNCSAVECIIAIGTTLAVANDTIEINAAQPSGKRVRISGSNARRVFLLTGASVNLTVNDLIVSNGYAPTNDNPDSKRGGAFFLTNAGSSLTLNRVVVENNGSGGNALRNNEGGAIYNNNGTIFIHDSVLSDNVANNGGSAIYSDFGVTFLNRSTVSGNIAAFSVALQIGGAIYNTGGLLNVSSSTFTGNNNSNSQIGTCIYNTGDGKLDLISSTFSGNNPTSSSYPITNLNARATLTGNTVTANRGGVLHIINNNTTTNYLRIRNNIFSGNDVNINIKDVYANAPVDSIVSGGGNMVGTFYGFSLTAEDMTGVMDPNLAALADNGGSTQTLLPLTGSAAINFGQSCVINRSCPIFNSDFPIIIDQRGAPRVMGTGIDAGAAETNDTINVFTTADSGFGSLPAALAAHNYGYGSGTINFNFAANDPNCDQTSCTIRLIEELFSNNANPLTIDGAGAKRIVLSGDNQTRVFYNAAGANATLKNLTLRDGNGMSSARLSDNGDGGGVVNRGTLRLENVWVTNNSSNLYNGAIGNHGNLTIVNSTVSGNNSGYNSIFGTTGGIGSDGQLFVVNSTISGNRSHNNAAGGAGGIFNNGDVYLVNTTVADNQANTTARSDSAAGTRHVGTFGIFWLRNSIVAANRGNATTPDTIGIFSSSGNNLIGNKGAVSGFNQPGDQTGTGASLLNPLLAPLGNYGGQTPTHAVLNNSAARDAGNNCVLNAACNNLLLTTDQRGSLAPRKIGANVDIGAFESNISFSTSATGNGGQGTLPDAQAAQNYSVTFMASRLNNLVEFVGDGEQSKASFAPFTYSIIAGSLPFGLTFNQTTGELSGTIQQGGSYTFTILAIDADGIAGAQSYNLTVISPTAATVSIGGRVLSGEGRGIGGVSVVLTDQFGNQRMTRSNGFGFYRFADLTVGQVVTINLRHKRFVFPTQIVNVTEEASKLNFIAQP